MDRLLKLFAEKMQVLKINYDFMEWKTTPIPYPYCVGQYFIDNYVVEEGLTEGQLLLVAWDKGNSFSKLIEIDNKLKKEFADYRVVTNNTSISISYNISNSDFSDNELKKIEIRLDFSLWEGV